MAAVDLALQRVRPSERLAAEWRIGAIKASFEILRLSLSLDSVTQRRLLTICVCLLNARTRFVRLNHSSTTYANLDTNTVSSIQRYEQEIG